MEEHGNNERKKFLRSIYKRAELLSKCFTRLDKLMAGEVLRSKNSKIEERSKVAETGARECYGIATHIYLIEDTRVLAATVINCRGCLFEFVWFRYPIHIFPFDVFH